MLDTDRATSATLAADQILGLRWLAALSLLTTVFYFTPQGDSYRWVDLSGASISVIVAAAALALTATTQPAMARPFALSAGGLCLLGAGIQFVSVLQVAPGFMGGNASTWTLLSGLGLGYLCLGLADRIPTTTTTCSD